jgi:hypothetical protein
MIVELGNRVENRQARACGPFRVAVVCLRITEIGHHAIAEILGDVTAELGYGLGRGAMIRSDNLMPFFGVEPRSDLR